METLFPSPITNKYRGAAIAKWFLAVLTIFTIARSLAHILLPDGGAQSIATIPLDSFSPNARAVVIHIFALWGLSQLLFGLFYAVVLWRCKSLIPLMYVFILIEYTVRLLLTFTKPMEIVGTAPGAIGNYLMIPLGMIMLILALGAKNRGSPSQ